MKKQQPTAPARAAFEAATAATATAVARRDELARRHAAAVAAVEAARAAAAAAEAIRAEAIREAVAAAADPAAAAAAARDHRLHLAAEIEDADDIAGALAEAIAEAETGIREARGQQAEAEQHLRVAEAGELRDRAIPAARIVAAAWRAHALARELGPGSRELRASWLADLLDEIAREAVED